MAAQERVGPGHQVLGRYEIVRHIATGGMGTVWEARDLVLDQTVALKQVGFGTLNPTDAEQSRLRTLREARFAAQLRGHHRVVAIYDVQEVDGEVWLVLEYLPSHSLADLTRDGETVDVVEAARIGAAVAEALAAAHERGIIHRDIKPGNVLLSLEGNEVKLTDFGISHAEGEQALTSSDVLSATPAYMSREVASGDPETPASDVFSLGATLYKIVEGRPPFGEQDNPRRLLQRVANGTVDPPQRAGPLTDLLMHLLELDPNTRPDATHARRLLDDFARRYRDPTQPPTTAFRRPEPDPGPGPGTPEPPDDSIDRRVRTRRRRRIALAGAAVLAVLALLVGGLAVTDWTDPTAVPGLPSSVPALTVTDPRTANPCPLLDPAVMARFGSPATVGAGSFVGACRLTNNLPDAEEITTELAYSSSAIDDYPVQSVAEDDLGGMRIVRKGLTPSGCRSYLRFGGGSQLRITTAAPGSAEEPDNLCQVHDAAVAVAADRLAENGITYTPDWQGGIGLARFSACQLPGDALEQVTGLDAAQRRGYPNGALCYIGGDTPGTPYAVITLGLEPSGDISGFGDPYDADGVRAYAAREPTPMNANPNACSIYYPHRLNYDGATSGPSEYLNVHVSGSAPRDQLCRQAALVAAAADRNAT